MGDTTSEELSGWFEYLQMDDEVKAQWVAHAIAKAFGGGGGNKKQARKVASDEEVIDTTDPSFVKHFQGFRQARPQPPRQITQKSTEFLFD